MSKLRVIKRYLNRKLYDTQESKYVTLEQIAEMIKEGSDLKVIENSTDEDITAGTLTQILFDYQRRRNEFEPVQFLKEIIRDGNGSVATHLQNKYHLEISEMNPSQAPADGEDGVLGVSLKGWDEPL